MSNLQDQSRRPKTALQEACVASHEETLHVSITACVEQNIYTQASMLHESSVQETEAPLTTHVQNHQTDSAAAEPASTILSTISNMKLLDIMDKMTSCIFGWSWRQVSLFDLTGKDTATEKPTVRIPCTAIVPVKVQELFFPCSLLEDTTSCNQQVEESMAVSLHPSLAELELCFQLTGVCDITARLCVVFRPECIVEVDCSIVNFKAISDVMRDIGLPIPTRSTTRTLAIMPPPPTTMQVAAALEFQPVECENHKMELSLLDDTASNNQVHTHPSLAELELRFQLTGVCEITARLCVVFRPECIVEVDCSIVNFEAIGDIMREIGLPIPTRSTATTLAIIPPRSSAVQVAAASEVQPVECDNHEMALSLLDDTANNNQVQAIESMVIHTQPSMVELELRLLLPGICDITARLSVVFRPECIVEVEISILRFLAISDDVREIDLQLPIEAIVSSLATMSPQSIAVQKVATSEVQPVDCDNYDMALVVPYQEILQAKDHEAQVESENLEKANDVLTLVNQPEEQDKDQATPEVQLVDSCNNEMAFAVPRRDTERVEDHKVQTADYGNHEIAFGVSLLEDNTSCNPIQVMETTVVQTQPCTAELELHLQLPGVCDITGQLRVAFRPECIAEIDFSILRFVTMGDDIREIDLQLPIEAIASSLSIMSPQYIAVQENATSEVQHVEYSSIHALPAVEGETVDIEAICSLFASMSGHAKEPASKDAAVLKGSEIFFGKTDRRQEENHEQDQGDASTSCNQVQAIESVDVEVDLSILRFEAMGDGVREIDLQQPIEAIVRSLATMSPQSIAVQEVATSGLGIQPVEHSSIPVLPAVEGETVDIDKVCSLFASMSGHAEEPASKDAVVLKGSEIFFGKTVRRQEEKHVQDQGDTSTSCSQVEVVESVVETQPTTAELELKLQILGICDITGRLRVVFRPECIVVVDFSILRFETISDDIREIDLQLPIEAIASSLATLVPQSIAVREVATSGIQPAERSSMLALPAVDATPEASLVENTNYELSLQTVPVQESQEIAAIESTEVVKPLDNATDWNAACEETTVNAQCDLQLKEPVNAVPELPSERIQLYDDVIVVVPEVPAGEKPTAEQPIVTESALSTPLVEEVQHTRNAAAYPSEEQVQPENINTVCHATPTTEDAQPTHNALEEVVTRGIKEIRESIDNIVKGKEDVPPEGPAERRRKRCHADDGNGNQLLSKDMEVQKRIAQDLSTSKTQDAVEGKRESLLVSKGPQRYPSDVHQALLTQTVDLLERGIELVSDDGAFIAIANPSSASRIGDVLTQHNFSRIFKRYDNDVLPQDLKQKVIERAALVAREHQDRVLESMAERPIFTLSEIRHYDCNGDYIMEDVSSPYTPAYPFTGIQPTPLQQCYAVNPFQTGITPQGLLTSGMHNPFQMLQQYQCTVNDIEMIDADELYMDIDENIDDMFMECEDQEDCPYCSQTSLNLFASLPTKYAISRRAIYSLLDERPLNPEIPSWSLNQGTKKSWFAYNTFSFRPEFDEPSGNVSRQDRVIHSVLDERPLNPVLPPSLARQSRLKSWFAYNTFSFREGDLVPVGSKCDCMQTTSSQVANTVPFAMPSADEPWPKRPEQVASPFIPCTSQDNNTASKSPLNTFSFSPEDHSSQQASIFGESKQESVFSFGKAEQPAPLSGQATVSSGISWKISFREEDDPEHMAILGENNHSLTSSTSHHVETDKCCEAEQQPTDLSLEAEKQAGNQETVAFSVEKEEPTFPVGEDSDSTSSETESHDDDLFDLNDENEEQTIKEIVAAVKAKLNERETKNTQMSSSEEGSNAPGEPKDNKTDSKVDQTEGRLTTVKLVKDNETASKEEPGTKQGVVKGQTNLEAKNKVGKTLMGETGQSQETNQVSQDASQTAKQESCSTLESRDKNNAEPPSKLTISHSRSMYKRNEPYPTQSISGLAAFMHRRVKMVDRDRLRTLQVSTQVSHGDKEDDSSKPVSALPENVQQRNVVSLKTLTGNTKTHSTIASKSDLATTIGSDAEQRKVVSSKSFTGNNDSHSSSKPDLAITISSTDAEERKVVCSKSLAQYKKIDSTTAPFSAVPPVQSDVSSSTKKISLKSLTQTKKKEPDVKGSEMDRLKSRHQRKDADLLSKPTPSTSACSDTANNIKRVSFAECVKGTREASTNASTPSVSSEKRSNVISLRSVVQSKKADEISKLSSSEPQAKTKDASTRPSNQIKRTEQTNKPAPKEGSNKPVLLESPTLSQKVDSMRNSIPPLPLVSFHTESNVVVSLNPLSEDRSPEASSKSTNPVAALAASCVQKTKVVSLKSLTQGECKKDEQVKKSEASVSQVASGVKESNGSCGVIKNKDFSLKPSTQCKKMESLKKPTTCTPQASSKEGTSAKKDLVKPLERSKIADPLEGSSTSPLSPVKVGKTRMVSLKSLTRGNKPDPLHKTVVSSPPVSTVAESSAKKGSFLSTDEEGKKSASNKNYLFKAQVSDEKNSQMATIETASRKYCTAETGIAEKGTFKPTQERPKEDGLTKSSPSVSLEKNDKMISLEESLSSSVRESSSAKVVAVKSTSTKKNALKKTSTKPASCERNTMTKAASLENELRAPSVGESSNAKVVSVKSKSTKKDALKKTSTEPASCKRNTMTKVASLQNELHAFSVSGSSSTKGVNVKTKSTKKDASKKTSSELASCERNTKVVSLKSVSQASSVIQNDRTKEVTLGSTTAQKEDLTLTKSFPSIKPVSCARNSNVVSLNSVSRSEKDGPMSEPSSSKSSSCSEIHQSEMMSFTSVTKIETVVPVSTSSVPLKADTDVAPLEVCAAAPCKTSDVKIDASAKEHGQQHPVSEPSNFGKRKTFQNLTSPHKRELDEMLEEDKQSEKERLRKFTSRRRKSCSGTPRKANAKPKSVLNSGDDDTKKNSEDDKDVKLVKTDVAQDTSVAKHSSVTTKEIQPISLTVDVVTVKDAKNESTPKWKPGTLEETKPSPEGSVALTDVLKSNSNTQSSQGTSKESNLKSLTAVKTGNVNASGGSAVQSSPALPNPNPLLPAEAAEGIIANTVDTVIVAQCSRSITPTITELSPLNDTVTVSKDASNTAESIKAKDDSGKSCLPEPEQRASSMDLVKEPLCLAGIVAISGENQGNSNKIPQPVPQPAAENVTLGKRKLEDMQLEDEKIPTFAKEKPVEVRKKRRWRTEEKPPENDEKQNKPRRRIVRNTFKKG